MRGKPETKVYIVGERLRALRESIGVSQMKLAKALGIPQSSLFRYEVSQSSAPFDVLLKYAEFFDVSMDYIFGRTDDPHGKYYENDPKVEHKPTDVEMFIEMCFEPGSPMNKRLKKTLARLVTEEMENG